MIRNLLIAGAASFAIAAPALAQEVEVSGNVTVATEYVWRGIQQNEGEWAIQGGFDLAVENFYAGTWLSNVNFGDDANIEMDLYAGVAGEVGGLGWDVGAIYYAYPDAEDLDYDFVEIYGGLSTETASGVSLGGYLYYDPDNETAFLDTSIGYGVTDSLALDATLGTYLDGFDEYTYWSIGATYSAPVGVDLGLRYWDNDVDGADDAIVFSISAAT